MWGDHSTAYTPSDARLSPQWDPQSGARHRSTSCLDEPFGSPIIYIPGIGGSRPVGQTPVSSSWDGCEHRVYPSHRTRFMTEGLHPVGSDTLPYPCSRRLVGAITLFRQSLGSGRERHLLFVSLLARPRIALAPAEHGLLFLPFFSDLPGPPPTTRAVAGPCNIGSGGGGHVPTPTPGSYSQGTESTSSKTILGLAWWAYVRMGVLTNHLW